MSWLLQSRFFSRFPVSTGRVTANHLCYDVIPKWSLLSFLGSLLTGTWGLMAFVRKTEKMVPRQICFPGLHLKIIWRMILPHVLSKVTSVTSPEALRHHCHTEKDKTQEKKHHKATALQDNIMLRSEYFLFDPGTLRKEQSRDKRVAPWAWTHKLLSLV